MDLEIYCLKCRNFTPYRNNYNQKQGEKAKCTMCGKKKNRFIKMKDNINDDKN